MLRGARKRLGSVPTVEWKQGSLLTRRSHRLVDAAACVLVLHHIDEPALAFREMARILRPGGLALVVDMLEHDRSTYRHTMGHKHLGFGERSFVSMMQQAGFGVRYRPPPPDPDGRALAVHLRRLETTGNQALITGECPKPKPHLTNAPHGRSRSNRRRSQPTMSTKQPRKNNASSKGHHAAGPIDHRVKDLEPVRTGTQGDPPRRARDAWPDGAPRPPQRQEAAGGRGIAGSLHTTVQTAVLIETLGRARAFRSGWASCNIFDAGTTPPRRSSSARTARPTTRGTPVFAWKGETLEEYWWCTDQIFGSRGQGPNPLLDDGATRRCWSTRRPSLRKPAKSRRSTPRTTLRNGASSRPRARTPPSRPGYSPRCSGHQGRERRDDHGRHRLYEMSKDGSWRSRRSTSTTARPRASSDNLYGCRHCWSTA